MSEIKHIVFFSGGGVSFACAERVVEKHGKENVILLFSDTKSEDPTTYKFIEESAAKLGCELVILQDGRDVWEVAEDDNFIFNSKIANCTTKLKVLTARDYIKTNYKPEECVLYLGIDWTETHRIAAPIKHWAPYKVEFPMAEAPYLMKADILKLITDRGMELPLLYKLNFAHNNCGGFCFKAGIGHFIHLLNNLPERFYYHAEKERVLSERLEERTGTRYTILYRTVNGERQQISLYELAALVEADDKSKYSKLHERYVKKNNEIKQPPLTADEKMTYGGCGCFINEADYPE